MRAYLAFEIGHALGERVQRSPCLNLAVIERIATDPAERTAREIDALRSH
jgi:hypothetical protein